MAIDLTFQDIETVARTIDGEAATESRAGQFAVACVVMNRVLARSWWGRTPTTVCVKKWQFSCWNADNPRLKTIQNRALPYLRDKGWFDDALKAARVAGTAGDPSCGACHYHADYIAVPKWAKGHEPVAVIGRHLFYAGIR